MSKIKVMEHLDTDTGIGWWDTNRKKLNEVIELFNDWQIVHRFSEFECKILRARIKTCRKFGEENTFSRWQFELLEEMESHIEIYGPYDYEDSYDDTEEFHFIEEVDENTSIPWWNQNRKKLNDVIRKFNEWQTLHHCDSFERDVVQGYVSACRKFGEENTFSDWHFEILDEIEEWLNKKA